FPGAGRDAPTNVRPARGSRQEERRHQLMSTPVLELSGIYKTLGAVRPLDEVDLRVEEGEVVALLGDNGAGKSTLVKVISGAHAADNGGVIAWDGKPVDITNPADAQRLGIATIYQDLALCDNLDIVGNLFLG